MLILLSAGFAAYYAVLALVGLLLKFHAIEGSLIAFSALCFVGAYFARSSKLVRRLCTWCGGIAATIIIITWIILPVIGGSGTNWVKLVAAITGLLISLRFSFFIWKRYFRRHDGIRPAPPLNQEWLRWVLLFGV